MLQSAFPHTLSLNIVPGIVELKYGLDMVPATKALTNWA